MAYDTLHSSAPSNDGDLTSSNVRRVEANPSHPLATTVYFPDSYDEFVSKTNDRGGAVLVEDEVHALSEILTGDSYNNSLYLYHKPRFQTSITVSDGVITNGTDYEHGVVYFSTLPTGDVTVQYFAEPDKVYGEHLTVIEAAIHKIQSVLGAGQTTGEGMKNAEFWVDDTTPNLNNRMPNAISMREIPRDISIKSAPGESHEIGFGNGADTVLVDAATTLFKSSTGDSVVTFGISTGDEVHIAGSEYVDGEVYIGDTTTSAWTGISASTVTGFQTTGEPYVDGSIKLAVHGSAVFYGNIYTLGTIVTVNTTRNVSVDVREEDLEVANKLTVGGDAILGDSTSRRLYVGGTAVITGGADIVGAGNKNLRVNRSIEMVDGTLGGVYTQGLVDGLDCSYIERVRKHIRSDFKYGFPNFGLRTALYSGTTTSAGTSAQLIDSGASTMASALPGGTYFTGRFNEGDYVAVITNGSGAGQHIPVKSFSGSAPYTWTLSRNISGIASTGVGVTYQIYHENGLGNFVQAASGLNVTIKGSTTFPLVATWNGVVKVLTSDYTLALPANTTSYIYMSMGGGANNIDQDEPVFQSSTSNVMDDKSVLIAKAVTNGSAVTSVVCYSLNGAHDTGWVKFDSAASGNVLQAGNDWTVNLRLGNTRRRYGVTVRGWIAGTSASAPDVSTMVELPMDSTVYVKAIAEDRKSVV